MRPLQLIMKAFGPYGKEEIIDFSELGQENIFVISGKTGSGKTTIFDAMSFALFGKANTGDRDGVSLRSHFANEADVTEVGLSFSLRGKMYLIVRQPQQEIIKKNGAGTRVVNATASLFEYAQNQQIPLATSVRDVDLKIQEIIQLNVEQFRQILMIPQGEFRELLVAPSKDKQVILQKLAGTEIYKAIEESLKEQQKTGESEIKLLRGNIAASYQSVFSEEETLGKTTIEINSLFEREINDKKGIAKQTQESISVVKIKAENALKDLALAENRQSDWDKLEQIGQEVANLKAKEPENVSKKNLVQKAKKAMQLNSNLAIYEQVTQQTNEYQEQLVAVKAEIIALKSDLEAIKREKDKWDKGGLDQVKREKILYQLQELEMKIGRLSRSEKDLASYQVLIKALVDYLTGLEISSKGLLERKETFQAEEEQIRQSHLLKRDLEASILKIATDRMIIDKELSDKRAKKEITANIIATESLCQQAKKRYEESLAEVTQLEEIENSQQAAKLAKTVIEGEACPVCGSSNHPHLARTTDQISLKDLQEAKEFLLEATEKKQQCELELEKYTWQLGQVKTKTDVGENELAAAIKMLTENLIAQEQKLSRVVKLLASEDAVVKNIAWINKELNEQALEHQLKTEELNKVKPPAQQMLALVEMLKMEIPSEFTNSTIFFEKMAKIASESEAYLLEKARLGADFDAARDKLNHAETMGISVQVSLSRASAQRERLLVEFEKLLVQNDFATMEAFREANLSVGDLEVLEADILAYEQALFFAIKTEVELAEKMAGTQKPDIVALKLKLGMLRQELAEKEQLLRSEVEMLNKLEGQYQQYQLLFKKIQTAELEYAELGELAEAANGKNMHNLGFERYVLASFLDTILERSNERLNKMTGGRFLLLRKVDKAKHNAQSGLDLLIYDEYTGKQRDVTTLSGGESFKTSLALALALADVVQEMSGGISLDTMFIDEGFGTLDPESLDAAVECLLETQENGRLVGIISHVPELKQRIGTRLEVTASSYGSSTKFIL
ncbi:MAG: AAA family ATPase [Culicoidibacterales bacterium]